MFQKMRFAGDASRRYSGKLLAIGKSAKKVKPALNVPSLTNNHTGVREVAMTPTTKTASVAYVRLGFRHS